MYRHNHSARYYWINGQAPVFSVGGARKRAKVKTGALAPLHT
ncbi:MAG TPA: hypothetical protein PKG57_14400 [Flavobacteriales bacterium]|nr:hypothetical protein [Flavobacteriales bacterium]